MAVKGPSRPQSLEEGKVGQGTGGEGPTKAQRAGLTMGRKHRDEKRGAETWTVTCV